MKYQWRLLQSVTLLTLAWFIGILGTLFAIDGEPWNEGKPVDRSAEESLNAAPLVLLLHFSEGEGATTLTDSSYVSNDVTCATCPDFNQSGKFGSAARFDGSSDFISIADDNNLDFGTGNFTLSIWFFPTTIATNQGLFDKTDGNNGYRFITDDDDTTSFEFIRGYNFDTGVSSTDGIISNNHWYHVLAVANGGNGTIYLNGVGQGTAALEDNANTTENLTVGYKTYGPSSVTYVNGLIDEVAIYSTALSAREVNALYRRGNWRHAFELPHCSGYYCDYGKALLAGLFGIQPQRPPLRKSDGHWTDNRPTANPILDSTG